MANPTVKPDEIIWMKCRANGDGCGANQAKVVFKKKLALMQGGGVAIRYQCTSCHGSWHIRL